MIPSSTESIEPSSAEKPTSPYRLVVTVASVIGLCILGDSLMYAILPLQASALGIPLPLVGVLLSANRLIRLVSNTWASNLFERLGPRRPFLLAALLGLISTALYGVTWGFFVFLGARIMWGIAWSSLRQGGYQAIWVGKPQQKGRLTGLLWGLVRLGSAVAAIGGGFLFDRMGYGAAVAAATILTALALPIAWTLSWPAVTFSTVSSRPTRANRRLLRERMQTTYAGWNEALQVASRRWLAGSAFVGHLLAGVVIATTSLFLAQRLGEDATLQAFGIGVGTLTGLLLGTRWLLDLVLGPTFGFLSDRWGQANMAVLFASLLFLGLVGMSTLPVLAAVLSLLVVFVCDAGLYVVLNAAASGEARHSPRPHLFVGVYTTTSDAGSALGPLLAFSVGTRLGFSTMYLVFGLLLALFVIRYRFCAADSDR